MQPAPVCTAAASGRTPTAPLAVWTPRSPGAAACHLASSRLPHLLPLLCLRRRRLLQSWLHQPHLGLLHARARPELAELVLLLVAAPLALASWKDPLAAESQD